MSQFRIKTKSIELKHNWQWKCLLRKACIQQHILRKSIKITKGENGEHSNILSTVSYVSLIIPLKCLGPTK